MSESSVRKILKNVKYKGDVLVTQWNELFVEGYFKKKMGKRQSWIAMYGRIKMHINV